MGLKSRIWFHRDDEYPQSPDDELLIRERKGNICSRLCSPVIVYGTLILFVAVAGPILVYVTVFAENPDFRSAVWRCDLKVSYRVECMKGISNIDAKRCEGFACCWNQTEGLCYHSLPSRHSYSVANWTDASMAVEQLHKNNLELSAVLKASPYGNREIATGLGAAAIPVTDTHLRVFLWNSAEGPPTLPQGGDITSSSFEVTVYGPEYFSLEIMRRNDNAASLLSTSRGPTIASKNYWELTMQFPTDGQVFGFGELQLTSSPKVMYNNADRLSANPFIMVLDNEGRAHGVLFNNPGPMEFELLANSNILIVRSLSTIYWDFSIFAGPSPADVMEQFTLERRPILPPAWALGLHICRETNETTAFDDLDGFMKEAMDLGLPYESDCLQDRFLGGLNFSVPDYIKPLIEAFKGSGKKIMVTLQPQVDPELATNEELFVLDESGAVLQDDYKSISASFPDVLREETSAWLKEKLQGLQLGDQLGGYVLVDEWPSVNSSQDSDVERMDYVPDGALSTGTLWWMVLHGDTPHYLRHNEYAYRFAERVLSTLDAKEQIVLSSSTYIGSGTVGGSHSHSQDEVECTWSNLMGSLKTVLGQGLAGIPLAGGGPICGNVGDYDNELCLRWYLMSSLLPIMRVSSERPLRDPVNLRAFKETIKNAVLTRYSLLGYMYSLFLEATNTGVPVARPMFFEFPSDKYTWLRDDHFMLGPALLVRPMFVPGGVSVPVYLPEEDVPWYHFHGGHKINNGTGGYEVRVPSVPTDLVVLLRGGYIVATQDPTVEENQEITVEGTLAKDYTLTVGLNCTNSSICMAEGSLNVGSDASWTATADETGLELEGACGQTSVPNVDSILVYGLNLTDVQTVKVSITPTQCAGTQPTTEILEQDYVLRLRSLAVKVCCGEPVRIEWTLT